MPISSYRDLPVWQKAVAFVTQIYEASRRFPDDERFGLTSQIRRCSISIPSNIAEGYGRHATNDYIRFLRISVGSVFEVQTQLLIAKNLGSIEETDYVELEQTTHEIERMLTRLIRKLRLKAS